MKIADDKVVSINYTLTDDKGTVIDSSKGRGPLSFIFGTGSIIPGLENELAGREKGQEFSVTIEPKEAYGEYDDSMMFEVAREQFQDASQVIEGMQVQAQNSQGQVQVFTVKSISEEKVKLDGNHPLAGQTLHFDVEVMEVRDASKEEIDHGHVH